MDEGVITKKLLALYSNTSWVDRQHLRIRLKRSPYFEIERLIPKDAKIIDVGCGHGLFCNFLSFTSPERNVTGVDISKHKTDIAIRTVREGVNINFFPISIMDVNYNHYEIITMISVLYLLPFAMQEAVLYKCASEITDGSRLLLVETDIADKLKAQKSYWQEFMMVKVFKRTMGQGVYFRSSVGWSELLAKCGLDFKITKLSAPTPSNLFICRKR